MKTYSKPQLVALSLTSNDLLCACAVDVKEPYMDLNVKDALDLNGWLSADGTSAISGVFTEDNNSCSLKLEGYCKFNPGDNVVFTS